MTDASKRELDETLGRYELVRKIGEGGMGAVYEAYDKELGRPLAIKRLRPHKNSERQAGADARVIREARALAQLQHPNVVAIYDFGQDPRRGSTFIAMELIEGQSLREFVAPPRPTDAVIDAFIQAGRGLIAAHQKGIVHRDFKPSNVLVDSRGAVKVLDFGLALDRESRSASRRSELRSGHAPDPEEPDLELSPRITEAGLLLGTPGYVAPEQKRGAAADERSDQFAFCVSLFEALVGRRPVDQDAWVTLRKRVSGSLVRVLQRGLDPDPSARHPSMRHLVSELERSRRSGRGALWWAALGAVGLVTAGVAWLDDEAAVPSEQTCSPSAVAAEWEKAGRKQLEATFVNWGQARGRAAAETVSERFEEFFEAWSDANDTLCDAGNPMFGDVRRRACLERAEAQAKVLLDVMRRPSPDVEALTEASLDLPDPSGCLTDRFASRLAPLPTDPGQAEQTRSIRLELARLSALSSAGEVDEVREQFPAVLASAEALHFAPLSAEALAFEGQLAMDSADFDDAGKKLEEAYFLASAENLVDVAVGSAAALAFLHGVVRADIDEASRWHQHAVATAGTWDHLRPAHGRVELDFGSALLAVGRTADARTHFRIALDLFEADAPLGRARARLGLAGALLADGDFEASLSEGQRAQALGEQTVGEAHPLVADARSTVGNALARLERYDDAIDAHETALELRRAALGDGHLKVAESRNNLGSVLDEAGRYAEAAPVLRSALAGYERSFGPEHPNTASTRANLGLALLHGGDAKAALEALVPAEEALARVLPSEHLAIAICKSGRAQALLELGRPADAAAHLKTLSPICEDETTPALLCRELEALRQRIASARP